MRVESGLSPMLALKSACVGKNKEFHYFEKTVRVKVELSSTSVL